MASVMTWTLPWRQILLACALLASVAVGQDAGIPEPSVHWFRVEIAGQRVGHSCSRVEHVRQGGGLLLRTTDTSLLNMGRLGAEVQIETETTTLERPDGTLVRCETRADLSNRETTTRVSFDGTTARVATTTAGRTRETKIEIPAETVGPLAGRRALAKRLDAAGTSFWLTTWVADLGDAVDIDVQIGEVEPVVVADGTTRRLVRVEKELDGLPMSVVGWHDDDGIEVVSRMKSAGLEIVSLLTTEADALAEPDEAGSPSGAPDVFAATMVFEPYHLPAPRQIGRAVVRVAGRDGPIPVAIPESPAQRLVHGDAADGQDLLFELQTRQPPPGHGGRRPLAASELPEELRMFLAPNSSIQSDDPNLMAKARELVGDQPDAWAAAQQLEAWVEEHVSEKGMDVAWATSSEVFEDRAGDCSEHAVLLAAMCRAAGIPCRVAMGSLYIGGTWAGHAWNEVWIDGDWYALDATLGMGHADAMRLTLGTLSLDDGAGAGEFAGLAGNLGSLSIETLEIGRGAASVRPAEARGRIEDGVYVDHLFGIRFELPAGVPFEIQRPGRTLSFELLDVPDAAATDDEVPFRLRLRAFGVEAEGGPPRFLPLDRGERIRVDGRPAWRIVSGDERSYVVLSRGNVFVFRFDEVDPGAEERAVEAVLESVDFDLLR